MNRLACNGIMLLYDEKNWNPKTSKINTVVYSISIIVVTVLALLFFGYISQVTQKESLKQYENILLVTSAILVILVRAVILKTIEIVLYGLEAGDYLFIDYINKVTHKEAVEVLLKNNKVTIGYNSILGMTKRTNLERLLKSLKCKYEFNYINEKESTNNTNVHLNIDMVSFTYVRVDVVVKD